MNAIDILGDLLGHKKKRGGSGADILKDMLGGATRKRKPPASPQSMDIHRQAEELEDLLNVAGGRPSHRSSDPTLSPASRSDARLPPSRRSADSSPPEPSGSPSKNQRSLILIRAMVQAAKADGQIDQTEQQAILDRLRNPSREAIDFLRGEFQKTVDVREFAASVPVGMEQQVYMMSLIVVDLDKGSEAKYLMSLADALRLPPEVREQIHQRLGAPSIY